MPNHVYSALKFIYHDDKGEMIEKISQSIKSEKSLFDFNKIIPEPLEIKHENPDILSDASCEWRKENWGTKWNAYDIILRQKDNWKMIIHFQTAWSVPLPILNKLSTMFPDVEINYIGADDGGWFACHYLKGQNERSEARLWNSENDSEGFIRSVIFESLNSNY